ncbi:MAG: hypothetical protein Q9180_004403 [Flavoplaca navasiana]
MERLAARSLANSPVHPAGDEVQDCVINVGTELSMVNCNGASPNARISSPVADTGGPKKTFSEKLKQCLPTSLLTAKIPNIPTHWRKNVVWESFIASLDDHPRGYPKLAAFISSSDNFLMCRRFAFLHSRVLLHRQDELAEMEKALIAMDDEDKDLDHLALQSRRRDDHRTEEPSRKSLMNKIDDKLKSYDDLIARIRTHSATPHPLTRDYASLYHWMDDVKPLCREEHKFIKYTQDLIALAEKQEGLWFGGVLEDTLSIFPFTRLMVSSSKVRKRTDDEYVELFSKYRVDTLVRLILAIVAVILLMVPTAVLYLVQEQGILKIVLIMIFTVLFSASLSVFTKAKIHEMFAATAA